MNTRKDYAMKQPAMLKHLALSALVLALCGCQAAGMYHAFLAGVVAAFC